MAKLAFSPTNELWKMVLLFDVKNETVFRRGTLIKGVSIFACSLHAESAFRQAGRQRSPVRMRGLGETNPVSLRRKLSSSVDRYNV